MREILTMLASSSLFSGLTETEIQEIQQTLHGEQRAFERDECLLRAGDPAKAFGILLSGGALVRQEDFWGNQNILSSLHPGDCFAESFACLPGAILNVDVAASQPCEALFLKTERLLSGELSASIGGQRFLQHFLVNLAGKNLRLNEKITHMGQRSTRAKILSYLSACARRQGAAEFDVPFSRQQLADYLSVDRSGLSAELCRLRDEGLMEFQREHFRLKKPLEEGWESS